MSEAAPRKRRKLSAAARRHMKEAQRLRWAKLRRESEPPAPAATEPAKPKRKLSKAGRAAIIAATKKRWALKRAEAAKAQRAAKKAAPSRKKVAVKKARTKKAAVKAPRQRRRGSLPQSDRRRHRLPPRLWPKPPNRWSNGLAAPCAAWCPIYVWNWVILPPVPPSPEQ